MAKRETRIITGILIEKSQPLTLEEISQAINLSNDIIIDMIEHNLFEPHGDSPQSWQFDSLCLRKAKIAASFYRDLEINISGIALALELLDKIENMQTRLDMLEKLTR